ncbi:hypothetical protein DENSPDRAFT_846287 [Dentipellis sp. KUC8613]|nr:hypothetical protein DENSPDRAFT_846287 [Dentipellis sp. KUC8613]
MPSPRYVHLVRAALDPSAPSAPSSQSSHRPRALRALLTPSAVSACPPHALRRLRTFSTTSACCPRRMRAIWARSTRFSRHLGPTTALRLLLCTLIRALRRRPAPYVPSSCPLPSGTLWLLSLFIAIYTSSFASLSSYQ